MRAAAILLALSVLIPTREAVAGARSAHFHVGVEVVSSAHLVTRATPSGVGLESRSFGGEARGLLVEQRSGATVSLHGSAGPVQVPREGSVPLLVRSAGELAFDSSGSAEVIVTLLADGLPPPLQKLKVTVMTSM